MENNKTRKIIIGIVVVLMVGVLAYYLSVNKPGTSGPESIVISEPAAVFFEPSDAWTEEMKKTYGEENFQVVAEGSEQYQNQAKEFLEDKNIKIITTEARYLEFLKDSGEKSLVDRAEAERGGWGIYFFNGVDNPIDVSGENIEAEYSRFFTSE